MKIKFEIGDLLICNSKNHYIKSNHIYIILNILEHYIIIRPLRNYNLTPQNIKMNINELEQLVLGKYFDLKKRTKSKIK